MDKDELNALAKKATDLWQLYKYDQADECFQKVYPYLDRNHWRTTDFLNYYGLNLEKLGRHEEAAKIFSEALECAHISDSPSSVTVTYARFNLGEHLIRQNQLEQALEVISPALEVECDSKWLVVLLACRIYFKQSKEKEFQQAASALLLLGPKNKFKSINQVRELIESEQNY